MLIPSKLKILRPDGCLLAVRYYGFLLALLSLLAGAIPARATITVLNYWRMGEADAGAVTGGTPVNATDSVGSHTLKYSGSALYSTNVAPSASAHAGSDLCVSFTNSACASNSIVSTVQNNFGVEAWVKPVSTSGNPVLVYNGGTGSSGWGFMINNGTYQGLFGDVNYIGSGAVVLNQWIHLAIVCNNGVATLYTNGVAAGTAVTNTPIVPAGNFEIGAQTVGGVSQAFTGFIDEVRVFTFAAGQFNTNDLLLNLSPTIAVGATNLAVGPTAGSNSVFLAASTNALWYATANATWLHLATSSQSGKGCTNVIFTYDGNTNSTRTGTLTIAGQTVTVTQAGTNYVAAAQWTNLVSSGLSLPQAVAVDGAGNVYLADTSDNAIKKWTATNNTVTTLVSGLNGPAGVAVDSAGNVYIADTGNNALKKWSVATESVSSLVTSGLSSPERLAIDRVGNVYIADYGNSSVYKWTASSGTLSSLVTSGLSVPSGVAVDAAGNVYIADSGHNAIKEWIAISGSVSNLNFSGLSDPEGVAVDGSGNIYISDCNNSAIKKWTAISGTLATVSIPVSLPFGVAVDNNGNIYVADQDEDAIHELQFAFVNSSSHVESSPAGSDQLMAVMPTTANLLPPFFPVSDSPWLTVTGVVSGVVGFNFTSNNLPDTLGRTGHINVLGQSVAVTQLPTPYKVLGTTNLLVGPGSSSNSVFLAVAPQTTAWTASANATWLHVNPATQSGAGNINIFFSCDTNASSLTRTGTLTIAGVTLTVTQAGSNYVAAAQWTNLVSSGLTYPQAVAVDGAGNVYIADGINNTITKWTATNNTVTTLVSSGLSGPDGVAVDSAGNVYISDANNNALKKWYVATGTVSNLVTSGLSEPAGLAIDSVGNVYIADEGDFAVKKWIASSGTLSSLVTSGLAEPQGVAVNAAGDVYIADAVNNVIKEWIAATGTVSNLITSGLSSPESVAVDGCGNCYISDDGDNAIKKWTAVSGTISTLPVSVYSQYGMAVDANGNIYVADTGDYAIRELQYGFVNTSNRLESSAAGGDQLPVVLPATANLQPPFFPTRDYSWLTVTGVVNNAVGITFTSNSLPYTLGRTAHVSVLGQAVPVTQLPTPYEVLGTTNLLVGPGASSNSVILAVTPQTASWTASANATWLHVSPATQSGTGNTNIFFSCDTNTSSLTRTGTLTIAGATLTFTQAGSNYVAATIITNIVTGLNSPAGVACDAAGNVYIADTENNVIKEWTQTNNTVSILISSSSVSDPRGVAVDSTGNVYFSDADNNGDLKKWAITNSNVTVLVSYNSNPAFGDQPEQIALDLSGNAYVADSSVSRLEMWSPVNSNVTVLVSSGLSSPYGVAVDGAGNNVYIADTSHNATKHWLAATKSVSTVVSSGLNYPRTVDEDGSGNIIIDDNDGIKKWSAVSNVVTTLVSSSSGAVAMDTVGNIYIADVNHGAIEELPHAFVPVGPVMENDAAGQDSLPVVLPVTANLQGSFTPFSDSSWLTINGVTNGVVYYSFTANHLYAPIRTAHIFLLGQSIAVIQSQVPYQIAGTTNLLVGPLAGSNSVALEIVPATVTWTASANNSWLHLTPANQTGTGGTNVIFSYDANTFAATRTGTLTIAGQAVYVTQAGSNYVSARVLTTLASNQGFPAGLAVDGFGNVYLANTGSNSIVEWLPASNSVTTLVSSGLNAPGGVAVDSAGNVYIADSMNSAVKKWLAASHTVVTLASISSTPVEVRSPQQLALDAVGDIYIADSDGNAIEEWVASNSNVVDVVSSGLAAPTGVAADFGGNNIYLVDSLHNAIKKWTAASGVVSTLVSSGLSNPEGMAADGSGNVYIANSSSYGFITEWMAASGTGTNLIPSSAGLTFPDDVAVDAQGNVYVADSYNNVIRELTYAFVNSSAVAEGSSAGSDSLSPVLPTTENLLAPFAPTNDSTWLAITGVTNGVISFAFTANTNNTSRTAHIGVLGQVIPITQSALILPTPPLLTSVQMIGNGTLQFSFTNTSTASFTVWSTTNLLLPFTNWTMAGTASNLGSGQFQFTSPPATNAPGLFYRVTSP